MNLIEQLTEKYATEKANMLDRHLLKFLAEKGLANKGTPEEIIKNLKEAGLELIQQVDSTLTQEVYTFKLCKVYDSTQLTIPKIESIILK